MKNIVAPSANTFTTLRSATPDNGIAPGTPFEELPDGWICPVCGEPKEVFEPID